MVCFDYSLVKDALTGMENECGDDGIIIEREGELFVALMDALGHGEEAYQVVSRARAYVLDHADEDLTEILIGLNRYMQGTRGLVAALCRIDAGERSVHFTGIGNICTRIHGKNDFTFIPRDGVVGYLMPTPRQQETVIGLNDVLILSSDGIKEHLPLIEHPDLLSGSSGEIASRLLDMLRNRDDASCLVVRCRKCTN